FAKVLVWDPTRMQQTDTFYDNGTESGTAVPQGSCAGFGSYCFVPIVYSPGYYPGVDHPTSVTTITAIPASRSQSLPAFPTTTDGNGNTVVDITKSVPVNARVEQTVFNNTLVQTNGGETYRIDPAAGDVAPAQVDIRWETNVHMNADVTDPSDPT